MSHNGRNWASVAIPLLLLASVASWAAAGTTTANRKAAGTAFLPEVVGAKAFIEDMLARRYTQELATIVDRPSFSLGVQLELVERLKPKEPEADATPETPPDLVLGMLDPDALLKKYGGDEAASWGDGILRNYVIKAVAVSVGLREDLGPDAKAQVEKWLNDRLKGEFGPAGKGTVATIRGTLEKKVPAKTLLDWLNEFQALAGQIILALAILLGTLLWKLLSSKSLTSNKNEVEGSATPQAALAPPSQPPAAEEKPKDPETSEKEEQERVREEVVRIEAGKEARQLSKRIVGLIPKVSAELEGILRSWCQAGEEGKTKIACLVEALGETKLAGKLPIPVDSLEDLAKVFARMPDTPDVEKISFLKKAYWDLLMAANLGAETLEQPFSYLADLSASAVDGILIKQNPKMKAIVALYMPPELRDKYIRALDAATKRELIEVASQMDDVAVDEIRTFDGSLKNTLSSGAGAGQKKTVAIRPLLAKLIAPLTPTEQVTLLAGMSGGSFDELKRTTPTLAFVGFWPDDKLSILLSRAQTDEVVAFLRARPELRERFLGLSPPMTAEVAQDELSRPDSMSEPERNRLLTVLSERLKEMVANQEVDLDQVFKSSPQGPQSPGSGETDQRDDGKAA